MKKNLLLLLVIFIFCNISKGQNTFVGIDTKANVPMRGDKNTFFPIMYNNHLDTYLKASLKTYNNEKNGRDRVKVTVSIDNPVAGDKLQTTIGAYDNTEHTSVSKNIYYTINNENAIKNELYTFIRDIKFKSIDCTPEEHTLTIKLEHKNYLETTNHFYMCVNTYNRNAPDKGEKDYDQAKYAAEHTPQNYNLPNSYLATITSAEENAHIFKLFKKKIPHSVAGWLGAWFGATDKDSEGTFVWDGGPEQGQPIGPYTNWRKNNPATSSGNLEDYTVMGGKKGKWYDVLNTGLGLWVITGYIVEFGGMPNDPPIQMQQKIKINVGPDPKGIFFEEK